MALHFFPQPLFPAMINKSEHPQSPPSSTSASLCVAAKSQNNQSAQEKKKWSWSAWKAAGWTVVGAFGKKGPKLK